MYEHPSYIYNTVMVEQERIDRANELRRIIAENPERIVTRRRPVLARVREWFGAERTDAAAAAVASAARVSSAIPLRGRRTRSERARSRNRRP